MIQVVMGSLFFLCTITLIWNNMMQVVMGVPLLHTITFIWSNTHISHHLYVPLSNDFSFSSPLLPGQSFTFLLVNNLSNSPSKYSLVPRQPATTWDAHLKYSSTLVSVHPKGLHRSRSRRLYSLSASFTSLASWEAFGALMI